MLLVTGISGVLTSITEIEDGNNLILPLVYKIGLVTICKQPCTNISPFWVM